MQHELTFFHFFASRDKVLLSNEWVIKSLALKGKTCTRVNLGSMEEITA